MEGLETGGGALPWVQGGRPVLMLRGDLVRPEGTHPSRGERYYRANYSSLQRQPQH